MDAFRRSVSFQRHRRSDSESQLIGKDTPLLRRSEEQDRDSLAPRPRSSFDTFIIPNRTRYPSDKTRISEPTTIDLHIAASLLNRAQSEPCALFRRLDKLAQDLSDAHRLLTSRPLSQRLRKFTLPTSTRLLHELCYQLQCHSKAVWTF